MKETRRYNLKDEADFRQFLKKKEKMPHVIEGLVQGVEAFEIHLACKGGSKLEDTKEQDVRGMPANWIKAS
jgi:hypothetical protein